jgi:RimJ/RimL family protein N-acetyltransferase
MPDFKIRQFLARLDHGDQCFLAWLDEELVHYSWVQTQGIHSIMPAGMKQEISPGEFWIYDCRTAELARGKHVYPFVLVSLLQEFFQKGFRKTHIYTTKDNLASQKGILRAGFQLYKTIKAISWLGRVWTLSVK